MPDWVIDPQNESSLEGASVLEEELTSLRNDIELRPKLSNSYRISGCRKLSMNVIHSVEQSQAILLAFPTSYLVEKGFSAVSQVLCKQRNRPAVTDWGDLRLFLTAPKPETDKLASSH